MTNLDVIKHLIGNNALTTDERLRITAQLLGLDPDAEFDPNNKCPVYKAAIQDIQGAAGVKEESEGGYKIVYADKSIPGLLQAIANDSGCRELIDAFNGQPKVRNRSNLW